MRGHHSRAPVGLFVPAGARRVPLRAGLDRDRAVEPRLRRAQGVARQEDHPGCYRPGYPHRRDAGGCGDPDPPSGALRRSGESSGGTGLRHEVPAARGRLREATGDGGRRADGAGAARGRAGGAGRGRRILTIDTEGAHMFAALRRILPVLAALPGVVLFIAPTWAQSQATALEEVVVTARKRDETIQNVPVTENVFTEQAIESAAIDTPRAFA